MAWITPKTNWNFYDYFNYEDLNRIENNTKEIATILNKFEANISQSYVLNRNETSIEFASGFNRIEGNIEELGKFVKPYGWQNTKMDWKDNDVFTYTDLNRMEKNLAVLYNFWYR